MQVIVGERCRRAHDVATESDGVRFRQSEKMRADDVLNVRPPVQKLVDLDVGIIVGLSSLLPVVQFRKKTRRSQDETGQTANVVEQLAQILGGDLGDAVDVP
ncbi:MAG TPA: hypothetical protein VNU19_21515, partial [Candidatus Acidoferrum sp.]|nr:hypothetical protein [Candidatus Acidoferrum sp.]